MGLGVLGKQLLRSLLVSPFRMKGQILAGATAEIHGVEPTERPEVDEEDGREDEDEGCPEADMNYFWIDVTITPQPQDDLKFRHWDPAEICLVPRDADVGPTAIDDDEDLSYVDRVEIWRDGAFIEDDNGEQFDGAKRVRLLMAVDPKMTTAKFRYYFEAFGRVELHRSVAQAA